MDIRVENYLIETSNIIGRFKRFNLYKIKKVEKGKNEGKEYQDPIWFDATFVKCLETIAQLILAEKGEIFKIQEYLEKFEEISTSLLSRVEEISKEVEQEFSKQA